LEQETESPTLTQPLGPLEEGPLDAVLPDSPPESTIIPQNPVLRISALCASFMLCAQRVRLRDFANVKQEYRELRLYALEDGEEPLDRSF
jgi:hypothetical protein